MSQLNKSSTNSPKTPSSIGQAANYQHLKTPPLGASPSTRSSKLDAISTNLLPTPPDSQRQKYPPTMTKMNTLESTPMLSTTTTTTKPHYSRVLMTTPTQAQTQTRSASSSTPSVGAPNPAATATKTHVSRRLNVPPVVSSMASGLDVPPPKPPRRSSLRINH